MRKAATLDDIDRAIIEQLQRGRPPALHPLGQAVGLSEAAVRQRVQRLIDTGVMQVVAVTDPLSLGLRRDGHDRHQGPRATSGASPTSSATFDDVDYVVVTAGSFDLLIEVVVRGRRRRCWS